MKHSGKRLFDSMQLVLGKGKANFSLATTGIIKMMLCLRILRSRKHLRNKSKGTRNVLNFLKGRERLDKEMDISYVIRHVRILRYFLRTVLDKD